MMNIIIPSFIQSHGWIIYLICLGLLAVLATYLLSFIHQKFTLRLLRKGYYLTYVFFESFHLPLLVTIWVEAVSTSLRLLKITPLHKIAASLSAAGAAQEEQRLLQELLINLFHSFHEIILIFLIGWTLVRFIRLFEEHLLEGHFTKRTPDTTMVQAFGKLLRVVSVLIILLVVLGMLNFRFTGLLALGGGSAIIIGIAVQPMLSNYFSGLMIYSDGFFKVGDWIYSADKKIEGIVQQIGWRSTRLRTFDRRPLYVPNRVFSSINIINASRMTNRRIKETFGIRYQDVDKMATITEQIENMLREHPDIDTNQMFMAHFLEFGPFSLNINVYAFTKTCSFQLYRSVQQDVFLKIVDIIQANGAALAVPARSVQVVAAPDGTSAVAMLPHQ